MTTWWNLYIVVFVVALTLSLIITPLCRKLAFLTGYVDRPKQQDHKTHKEATPLLGGLAICVSWLGTIIIGVLAVESIAPDHFGNVITRYFPGVHSVSREILIICLGAVFSMLLGLYDDRFNMSARMKLFGQLIIAVIVVTWGGVTISVFIDNVIISWLLSVFWILVIFNAINFFDNMDGLAVGTASIALCFFTISAAINQQFFVASLCSATAGAAIGFWFFNHSPATIFMGDSGSHFLGYILAITGARVTYYNPELSTTNFPILIPVFILAIPLFDMIAVVVIRLRQGNPIYIGDNQHISHRFVKMGMSRKRAVFLVHLLTLLICLSVLPLMWGDLGTAIVCLVQACTILFMISILQASSKKDD